MGNEATAEKPNNRQKALDRIAAVLNKYKLIKAPVLIQEVVKHVYGDLKEEPAKADKAFGLISKLVNELVDNGTLNAFAFVNASIPEGQETPSVITETLLVLPSFQLVGYVPASFEAEAEAEQSQDENVNHESSIDDVLNELEVNEVISKHAEAYAIVPYKKSKQMSVIVRHSPEQALGKFLTLVAEEGVSANLYAMIPVNLEIKTSLETNDEPVAETNLDAEEAEEATT